MTATMWSFGDRWWLATIPLFMGRWVVLLPLALLLPGALALRRRLLVPLLAAAVVALGPFMGWRAGWGMAAPADDGIPFRAVTFNLGGDIGGIGLAIALPSIIAEWEADVVALQECGESVRTDLARLPGWHFHAAQGLCLLSRHPITDVQVMEREELERIRQDRAGIGGAGFVVRYAIESPAGPIAVTNLHLETARKGFEGLMDLRPDRLVLNTRVRAVESRRARSWATAGEGPVLVLGDFNTPVESRIYREHWGDLRNAFTVAGRGFGTTRRNGWIRVRIDHVLAGREWHVRSAHVGPELGSDHRPVIADLVLARR